MLCPLKLRTTRLDSLFKKKKKVKENISVNYEEDNVSLVLSKVPAQKCFFKYFFRWFVPDELWYIIPKKHPIMLGQNLLRLVRNGGIKI